MVKNKTKLYYDFTKFNIAKSALCIHCKECMDNNDFNIANRLIREMTAEVRTLKVSFK